MNGRQVSVPTLDPTKTLFGTVSIIFFAAYSALRFLQSNVSTAELAGLELVGAVFAYIPTLVFTERQFRSLSFHKVLARGLSSSIYSTFAAA